jgi:acetyl esterase/lipase
MPEMPPLQELVRMPIVLTVPGMDDVEVRQHVYASPEPGVDLTMDVYRPSAGGARVPVVVLVHGGPLPRLGAKNMAVFRSWGRVLAASGLAAVAFDHRFLGADRLLDAASDIETALAFVRERGDELGLDAERLALWAFSGGGPFLSLALRAGAPRVKAIVSYYAALDLRVKAPGASTDITDETRRDFSPAHHVESASGSLPAMLIARAGLDQPFLNATIDRFAAAALATNAEIDILNHPTGRHGFDFLDDVPRTKEILRRTLEFLTLRIA